MVEATGFEPTTFASRTRRATSCATPRFFQFLSIFVSGQTCGQATNFERFLEKCTARIVSVVKGFRGSKKSTKESPCGCPERNALPTALRLDLAFFVSGQTCGQTTFLDFSFDCIADEKTEFSNKKGLTKKSTLLLLMVEMFMKVCYNKANNICKKG